MNEVIGFLTLASIFLVIYHHVGFPILLKLLSGRNKNSALTSNQQSNTKSTNIWPKITIVIPAYNEAKFIAEKIRNLGFVDYPSNKLKIVVACDGCTDDTANIARQTAQEDLCKHLNVEVREFKRNRGKINVLNEVMGSVEDELVALSDVSALVSIDALKLAASRFEDSRVGAVNGNYRLLNPGSKGEESYWKYQRKIKQAEQSLGSVLGAHGAFYVIRKSCFQRLPADTINDDFVLPMKIVEQGFQVVYEPGINAIELEKSDASLDWNRRLRICAGNTQQLWRLKSLLSPKFKGVAFTFASGKALRVLMPYFMIISLLGSLALLSHPLFAFLALPQILLYAAAAYTHFMAPDTNNKILQALTYLVKGHMANLLGSAKYMSGQWQGHWNAQQSRAAKAPAFDTINPVTRTGKRIFDFAGALFALVISLPLFPIIALAIRLESPGPVLFKQLRIGLCTPERTNLFMMIKFRTMVVDAEKTSGAVWAKKNDQRITRVGNFLRKTRLDELPQLINVLVGDMSLIGPRPERPGFYSKLEAQIPFFAERTYGVLPGITGLAQVNQGYDTCIEDVRSKVGYDHSYALALSKPGNWLRMDLFIVFKTLAVMIMGRGQ